jgi:hypothetical protein
MTNKEIIDAIEAEIKKDQAEAAKVKLGNPIASATVLSHIAYVNGLRFAKELIEKRIEVTE